MKNLIYKELRFVILPATYLMVLLAALLLIPNYPYVVGISYILLMLFVSFSGARDNKDLEFTAMLPVPRNRVVLSKHITVVFTEALQLAAAIPFAILSSLVVHPGGNMVGMDANFAFFGYALVLYAIFNLIFLPWFFKTGYKVGKPMFFALIAYVFFAIGFEFAVAFVPVLHRALDGFAAETLGWRLLMLGIGAATYVGSILLSYRLSVKRFDRVNLEI